MYEYNIKVYPVWKISPLHFRTWAIVAADCEVI